MLVSGHLGRLGDQTHTIGPDPGKDKANAMKFIDDACGMLKMCNFAIGS
mgnify:CR=1 FL=1